MLLVLLRRQYTVARVLVKVENNENNIITHTKNSRVSEKTRADTLTSKSLQECVARREKAEANKSGELISKLPALRFCKL